MMVVAWATVSMPTNAVRRAARREVNVPWALVSAVFLSPIAMEQLPTI